MPLVTKPFSNIITFTRASTGTFTGSNGLIQTATTNTPRFDYDPITLAARGILIEEQRTNLLTYSEEFDNASWVKLDATITANTAVAPDGTLTMDKLVETTATARPRLRTANVSVTNGTSYVLSFYAKPAGRNFVAVSLLNFTTDVLVNISTGERVSGSTNVKIDDVGNGVYRVSIWGTFSQASGSYRSDIYVSDGTTNSYTGDGYSGVFIWGAQLEAGAFPTSYIPTVASQVTRSADVASVNTLSPWYNQSAMTFYAEYAPIYTASATVPSNTPHVLQAYNTAASQNNYAIRGAENALNQIAVARNPTVGIQFPSVNLGTYGQAGVFRKVGYAINSSELQLAVNGSLGTTTSNNAAALMATHDKMDIGSGTGGSPPYQLNGWLRRISYYPRRLSNAELQALTA